MESAVMLAHLRDLVRSVAAVFGKQEREAEAMVAIFSILFFSCERGRSDCSVSAHTRDGATG